MPTNLHANRGRALENLIDIANEKYYRAGKAVIVKQHTHWIPIRDRTGRIVSAKVEHKAVVDYKGTVKDLGPISFDAKETSSDRWYLSKLEPHQLEHLIKAREVGDICFILIAFWRYSRFFILPLENYLHLKSRQKSLRIQDCPEHAFETDVLCYIDTLTKEGVCHRIPASANI